MRLHIGVFGKRNVGKSSLINAVTAQELSIVSDVAGTTTDIVQKAMEMLPLGPVLFIDTAGIDDEGELGQLRVEKTMNTLERIDIALIVSDYKGWDEHEIRLFQEFEKRKISVLAVINKSDINTISQENLDEIKKYTSNVISLTTKDSDGVTKLKDLIIRSVPEEFVETPSVLGELIAKDNICLLVTPIDKEAPKGRMILPQVQTIRDILDKSAICVCVKESELSKALESLNVAPHLVVTDSQAFKFVSEVVPSKIPLTSFSILFARLKGDLSAFAQGAQKLDSIQNGDRILICESCTHHQIEDDIARVKLPRLIRKYTQKEPEFVYSRGHDFPSDLGDYQLIVHCGACMTNRREILSRIIKSSQAGVAITNYGIAISKCLGILPRALKPFGIDLFVD